MVPIAPSRMQGLEKSSLLFKAASPFLGKCALVFLIAGIAFGNAGTGYVHAMSYSFGATYHVPHEEANYVLFMAVFKTYQKKNPKGFISSLNKKLSEILKCGVNEVYEELDKLLNKILPLKKMS